MRGESKKVTTFSVAERMNLEHDYFMAVAPNVYKFKKKNRIFVHGAEAYILTVEDAKFIMRELFYWFFGDAIMRGFIQTSVK